MQFRNNIINTALLGTEKKQISASELPEILNTSIEQIAKEDSDNETKFLKTAAMALSFYKAGIQPLKLSLEPDEAPDEKLSYCSKEAIRILKETLDSKYHSLTWLWCKKCMGKNLIVQPHLLPDLFEWGVATKKYSAELFRSVIGNRGQWLSKFSDEWGFVRSGDQMTDWETGSIQQRVRYLEGLRVGNPASAIDKIRSVWKEENAANRVELLETIAINISREDEEFLIQISNDKSQKVKEKTLQLLKLIPDSQIILMYQQVLKESIRLNQSKMLGLINKISIDVKLTLNEEIFKTGIQNLSSDKKVSDDDYILMQLVAEVPPSFWESQFNCNPEEAVKWFATKDELKKFQGALCNAIFKFTNKIWGKEVFEHFSTVPVQLLLMLDEAERSNYAEKLLKENVNEVVNALRTSEATEWNYKFCKQLLAITVENPSYYNKSFYEGISVYLPSSIAKDLDSFMPSEEWKRNYWSKTSQEIKEFISIKEKIKNTF
jgi:hypothetical protein